MVKNSCTEFTARLDFSSMAVVLVLKSSPCFLIQAKDLAIDESSFTGETLPSPKFTTTLSKDADTNNGASITQRTNIAFMGTLVRCGRGQVM